MKRKILIGAMIVIAVILGWVVFTNAQDTSVPTQIADEGVSDAKAHMDSDFSGVSADDAQIPILQTDLQNRQQAILALATQNPPLQSAVALCVSNIALYCPGYTPPAPLVQTGGTCTQNSDCASNNCYGTNGINWTAGTCQ